MSKTSILPYRLGLPAWAYPAWKGAYFSDRPSMLNSYAQVFNTVEGNTTFYGIPDHKKVAEWLAAVDDSDFQFCLKLPKAITHRRQLDTEKVRLFLSAIEPLRPYLGPLLIQLPDYVGPQQLGFIKRLLQQLPHDVPQVIEFRHPRFFIEPELLEPLFEQFSCGRVILDTRPIYRGDRYHPEVLSGKHQKPDLPIIPNVYNDLVYLRLVLHPVPDHNHRYVQEWTTRVAGYLHAGLQVYVMIHCPNNLHCPVFAQNFHQQLMAKSKQAIAPLPPWPIPQQQALI